MTFNEGHAPDRKILLNFYKQLMETPKSIYSLREYTAFIIKAFHMKPIKKVKYIFLQLLKS